MELLEAIPKKILKGLAIFFSFIFIFLIVLPYITPKTLLEKVASHLFKGSVNMQEASLAPFGKMRFSQIQLNTKKVRGNIDEIEIHAGLYWTLLFLDTTNISLKKPDLTIENSSSSKAGIEKPDSFDQFLFKLNIQNGIFRYNGANFSEVDGYLHTGKNFLSSKLKATASYGEMEGNFFIDTELAVDEDLDEIFFLKKNPLFSLRGSLDFNSKSLPLAWFPLLNDLLGSTLNSQIKLKFDPSFVGSLSLDSPFFYLDGAVHFNQETLSFSRPCTWNYVFNNRVVERLNLLCKLEDNASIGGTIHSLDEWSVQLKNPLKFRTAQQTKLSIQTFHFHRKWKNLTLESQLIQPKKGYLSLKTLKDTYKFQINDLSTSWGELWKNGEIFKQLGPSLSLKGDLKERILTLLMSAENFSLPATKIQLTDTGFSLMEPTNITSNLGNYAIKKLIRENKDYAFLIKGENAQFPLELQDYQFDLTIKEVELEKSLKSTLEGNFSCEFNKLKGPYSDYFFNEGSIMGEIRGGFEKFTVENVQLKVPEGHLETAFSVEDTFKKIHSIQSSPFDLRISQGLAFAGVIPSYSWKEHQENALSIHLNFLKSSLDFFNVEIKGGKALLNYQQEKGIKTLEYKTEIHFSNQQKVLGFFNSEGSFTTKKGELKSIDIEMDAKNFPVQLFGEQAADLFGSSIQIQAKAKGNALAQGELRLENPLLRAELFGTYSKEGFTLSKNLKKSTVSCSLSSLENHPFIKEHKIKITGGGQIKIDCQSLFFPFDADKKELELVAQLEAKNIGLSNERTGANGYFHDTYLSIDKRSFGPFTTQLDTTTSQSQIQATSTKGASSLRCIYDPLQPNSLNFFVKFEKFPSLDFAYLGSKLDGTAFIDVRQGNGKSALHLEAETFQIDLDAKVEKSVCTLTTPVKGRLKNLAIGNAVLQKTSWVPFTIPVRDVRIPLFPLAPQEIQVPKIVFSPFVVETKVEGNTKSVLSSLNVGYKGNVLIYCVPICGENQKLSLDQRPASASILNGTLYLPRIDLLVANKIWLVLWGSTDLKSGATTLILGISGLTLAQTLGIEQLSPTFVLPIRYSGKLQTIQLQKQDIVAAIAFLTAKIYSQRLASKGNEINLDFLVDQREVPPLLCPPSWLQK